MTDRQNLHQLRQLSAESIDLGSGDRVRGDALGQIGGVLMHPDEALLAVLAGVRQMQLSEQSAGT